MSLAATFSYLKRFTTHFDAKDIPDLHGKVAIVTGGNSGIGYHTVQQLAIRGARVYLAARNETRAYAAIARMKREGGLGTGSVDWLELDLSSPRKSQASALEFLMKETRLDILVCNAGILTEKYDSIQEAGFEISYSMSVCHLGHFIFTNTLHPILKHTALDPISDVRIIVVSSEAHRGVVMTPNLQSLEGWNIKGNWAPQRAYRAGLSKLANILFAKELQFRMNIEHIPITVMAIHPGEFASEGFARGLLEWIPWPFGFLLLACIHLFAGILGGSAFIMTTKEGSYTSLWAATSPAILLHRETYKGAYLTPYDTLSSPSRLAQSEKLSKDLWEFSADLANKCLDVAPKTL